MGYYTETIFKMRKIIASDSIDSVFLTLILDDGTNYGSVTKDQALSLALDKGLDLVQVQIGDNDNLPICKIMDYSKMKYKMSKRKKEKSHKIKDKEVRISFSIADHDLMTKNNQVKKFINKGHNIRYVMRLFGREKQMKSLAMDKFNKSIEDFSEIAEFDDIRSSGEMISVILRGKKTH